LPPPQRIAHQRYRLGWLFASPAISVLRLF
jgi:hypothetical protein